MAAIAITAVGCSKTDDTPVDGSSGISDLGGKGGAGGSSGISDLGGSGGVGGSGVNGAGQIEGVSDSGTISALDASSNVEGSAAGHTCGDIVIETALDLKQVAGCTSISGDLTVSQDAVEITELKGLETIQTIEGGLYITGPSLTTVDGLKNLTKVGGDLMIQSIALTSLDGLKNLESVGRDLYLIVCLELTDLKGLERLRSIGGVPTIRELPKVPTCQAIELLERINPSGDAVSQFVCGTLMDECGGTQCGAVT